ncbi:MAG TPA: KH domain-containing protein [Candidatus Saccharimonadales bacterium]|nr:KH domain-containing protein [Candidatus Saccharimonadales bacterium]
MAASIDQQFIEYIVKSLVGKPDEVKVERRIDEKGVLLELTVDPEDLGRVIGKRGSTAQSLRTLLRALGTKNDARYNLKIVDTGPPPEKRKAREDSAEAKSGKIPESEPVAAAADEPAKPADDIDIADEDELPETPSEDSSDVVSRTRKELADLDDLDV